jgi:putative DNA methylase
MLELEAKGFKTLDNYQNFAKAYKVRDFKPLLASHKANAARLKSAQDFGRTEISGDAELANTPLRSVLYALMELQKDLDGDDVLTHLSLNVPDYYPRRPLLVALADYLARTLKPLRDDEARQAAILRELVRNQPL